ncbi:MAG: PLP-dependent aminotransferase family protein [Acidovorax sp.]
MARGKAPIPIDLPKPIGLNAEGTAGKQESIYSALRESILAGLLATGSQLPSTRSLALRWQVSRETVEVAFDRLRAEGYVARRPGSGTTVSTSVPDRLIAAMAPPAALAKTGRAQPETALQRLVPDVAVMPGVPFIARLADPSLFKVEQWARQTSGALIAAQPEDLAVCDSRGLAALRSGIADYLRSFRGIPCDEADIIVTTGIRHATALVVRALLHPGDTVCVEDPGYVWARRIVEAHGAKPVSVPVDEDGLVVSALEPWPQAKLVYVTPAHQAPLGVTMAVSRRLELLEWAAAHNAYLIEDDYDSEFNYNSSPLPALKSIDRVDRVIYVGSFNKTLFANLRVGYMVAPHALRERLTATLATSERSVGIVEQLGVTALLASGSFVRHLRTARQSYQSRRDLVIAQLGKHTARPLEITGQQAGFHFILWLPKGCNDSDFCARAQRVGIRLQTVASFCHSVKLPPGVLIGYTALSPAKIRHAARLLAQLLDESNGGSSHPQ